MKKVIGYQELQFLSFPDAEVKSINFNQVKKNVSFLIDSAFLDKDSGYDFGSGELMIWNWQQFSCKAYNFTTKEWNDSHEELKDIMEIEILPELIRLAGFGKQSGLWTEYKFTNAEAQYESV